MATRQGTLACAAREKETFFLQQKRPKNIEKKRRTGENLAEVLVIHEENLLGGQAVVDLVRLPARAIEHKQTICTRDVAGTAFTQPPGLSDLYLKRVGISPIMPS
eukprot:3768752-Rhodomonas_salina.1